MAHPWPNAVDYPTVLNHHLVKAARLIDLSKSSLLYHLSILPFQRRFLSKETSSSNSNSKNFKKVGQNFFQTETEFFLASQFFDTGQFSFHQFRSLASGGRERENHVGSHVGDQRKGGEKKGKRSLRSAIAGRLSIVTLPVSRPLYVIEDKLRRKRREGKLRLRPFFSFCTEPFIPRPAYSIFRILLSFSLLVSSLLFLIGKDSS